MEAQNTQNQKLYEKKIFSPEQRKNILKSSIHSLKQNVSAGNYILRNLDKYSKSKLFKKITLKKGEILFDEGTIDNNLYIITEGHLSVEKYTTNEKKDTKQLAILKRGDFLGEGALKENTVKQNKIVSIDESKLLMIDAKTGIMQYIVENPQEGLDILVHIIDITNKRLLDANSQITANYEMYKAINTLKTIGLRDFLSLIDKFANIIDCNYILYFEKSELIDNITILKYDSRHPGKLKDRVYEVNKNNFIDIMKYAKELDIRPEDYCTINEIKIGDQILGHLILGRQQRDFLSSEKKMIAGVTTSLAGVLKQFILNKEDRNRVYLNEI